MLKKLLRPLLYYFISLLVFIFLLTFISMGKVVLAFSWYTNCFICFHIVFASVYFYFNRNCNKLNIIILSTFALISSLLISEVFHSRILMDNIVLPIENIEIKKVIPRYETIEVDEAIPDSNIDKALYYLDKKEFSSAWIYADRVIDSDTHRDLINKIKEQAHEGLKNGSKESINLKYLQDLRYKNYIKKRDYLGAYYFSLDMVNNFIGNNDFNIKMSSSYSELLKNYYSIDYVEDNLSYPGYSDIQFYYNDSLIKIEKLVEHNDEFFIQNFYIEDRYYPYIYIDKDFKLFYKGFREEYNFVYEKKDPNLNIKPTDLKLFSKEYYQLSKSSLFFNLKIFSIKSIKYFKNSDITSLIISRLTAYYSIFIIFFISYNFIKRDFINYLFLNVVIFTFCRWIINKIGLELIDINLGLTILNTSILYGIWLFILIKRFNPEPSRS